MRGAFSVCCSLLLGFWGAAQAGDVQFDVIGVSSDWLAVREQVPAPTDAPDACAYPGLDPSRFVGVRIHFMALTQAAQRGSVVAADSFESTYTLYAPAAPGACTDDAQARQQWDEVARRAEARGVALSAPRPQTLGRDVRGVECTLGEVQSKNCERRSLVGAGAQALRVHMLYRAVPQAPDLRICQFIGRQLVVVLRVSGRQLGGDPTQPLPGGVATHSDCRDQIFVAPRLYRLGERSVLVFGFRGANIADRGEHPFVVVF